MVIRKRSLNRDPQSSRSEPIKKLLGAGDAAEGHYRAGHGRDFHCAA